jgi:hypothetical protein
MTLTSTTRAPSAPLGRDETGALLGQTMASSHALIVALL